YQPTHTFDILSPKRQNQVTEILHLLEDYQPTKIAVEVRRTPPDTLIGLYPKWMDLESENQGTLDSLYQAYLARSFDVANQSNEIYQLGFRLAKRLAHKKIYAVDAAIAPSFMQFIKNNEPQIKQAYTQAANAKWSKRYRKLYQKEDS